MACLKVSPLFSNGMILQQGMAIPVSGMAPPETEITVSVSSTMYSTRADSGGAWRLVLDSQVSGGPHTMEIAAVDTPDKIRIDNVYFGDVWLCSGQSNMELPMQRVQDDFPEEWEEPVNSLIRQFAVPQEWDFSGPREVFPGGCWIAASNENLHAFSAAAWFFARALYEKRRIPIGLINAAWGGSPIEAWMSREALAPFPGNAIPAGGEQCAVYTNQAHASETAINAWNDALAAGDAGLAQDWHQAGKWGRADGTLLLPGDFSGDGLARFCGSIWLYREFEADAALAAGDAQLWLGTIVDADTVYVNGVAVGNTTYRYPPRKYAIPAGLLRTGTNRIVIRVICNNGQGGVTQDKPFRIFSDSGSIELAGTWEFRVGKRMSGACPEAFFIHRQPIGLFNAMIAPMLEYPCRGVIWYQGESNDPDPRGYAALFTALINDWRNKMRCLRDGENALPFLFVQLPIFGEARENAETDSWAILRAAQASALSLPATGMAAGLDLGEWNDLHPVNKKGIGRRLALAAEKVVCGNANTAPGPLLRGGCQRGNRLVLSFDNCGAGLVSQGKPQVSVVAGGKTLHLTVDITDPDSLSIDISGIQNAEKVLYAWANNPRDRQVYNADGLPMIPFCYVIPNAP